jgi:hypothetical protein
MTMKLWGDAFFKAYLRALSNKQLTALDGWQGERLADSPSKEVITDALDRKRVIYQEVVRRRT